MRKLIAALSVLIAFGALTAPAAHATPGPGPSALGVEDGDPMSYPSSAMGVLAGMYGGYPFNCSASAIDTPGEATVIMTAGHCAVDEDTGAPASRLSFLPAYRDGATPYGSWPVVGVSVDPRWQPPGDDDRAGDVAFMTLGDRDGWSLKELTGSIGIAFDQPTTETYTEWGYPEEGPYSGEQLVALTAGLAAQDLKWDPASLGIDSDFTQGSSGGPWTIGSWDAPTAVSETSYLNDVPDGRIWGPYFGDDVAALFASVGGDPTGAVPATPTAPRPRLRLRVSRRGVRKVARFTVTPGYPLNSNTRCLVKGRRWRRCRYSRVVPAGQTLLVKALYGVPGFRHAIGPRKVVGATFTAHGHQRR